MAGTTNSRELVLDILLEIEKNNSYSHIAINGTLKKYQFLDKQTRSFITKVAEGTIEYKIRLDYIINQFTKIAVKKQKPVIRNILRMSVYQILFLDGVPESAICNEAVMLTKKRGFKALSGFVNGVLRGIIRGREGIKYPNQETSPITYLSVMYSIPEWILVDWLAVYDYETVETILKSSLADNKTTIRCNTSKLSVEELTQKLNSEGIKSEPGAYVPAALRIWDYNYINRVKAFLEGDFIVQDESSMLCGLIANPAMGSKIIDVCAAPGGKSFHMADILSSTGHISARDLTPYKVELMNENLERLGFTNVSIKQWDALTLSEEDVSQADVVLADLPCSGLGIIGKKNDIKYNMSPEQQKELVLLQRQILDVVVKYVKPGGVLIYSTCTINPHENEENALWIADNYPFELEDITPYLPETLKCGSATKGYIQLLPGIHDCDGFFIAKLRRK